jgi:hypothetical protein
MSTRQTMDFDLAAAAARSAAAEAARRQAERAQLKLEQAALVHRETVAIAREHQRLTAAQLGRQSGALARHQADLDQLAARARAAGVRLDRLETQVQASRAAVEHAGAELRVELGRLGGLAAAAERHEAAVRDTLAAAGQALAAVESTAAANLDAVAALAAGQVEGAAFAAAQSDLLARLGQLDAEVSFLTQRADLTPVAMVTLQAMEENGYRLRDTLSRDGLIAYFEKEGEARWIAVRMAPVAGAAESAARWDLLAESFGFQGEDCRAELDDFETAVAEHGRLRRRGAPVYPRDDSQAVLPHPVTLPRRPRSRVATARERVDA